MDKQKRTTIDEFSAYLQSAVRNTTINYMNDKSKIKEHEITLEEDLEELEGSVTEWNEMMEAHNIFSGKIDPEKLLEFYSIVFQDVTLFNNTIMENIRIGKKDATDQEVMAAAKLAHCDEFVENMPDQWNTMIGENGSELSGGQRQRISIARAFLKDAPIILMDEATASLDVDNESMIQESISKLIENKTVLIIAHRMRTVDGVDQIVVLKDGVVFEQGKPQDLKQQNGIYKHMVEMQMQSHNWKYE